MTKDTRNFYVHAYGAIDVPSVWKTFQGHPRVKSLVRGAPCIHLTHTLTYNGKSAGGNNGADTMVKEYRRDTKRDLEPALPEHCFPDNAPHNPPVMR